MIDEAEAPVPEPVQEESVVTKKPTPRKRAAPKKAEPKPKKEKKETNGLLFGKYTDEAVFEVDLESSNRRKGGERFEHLKRLGGKKVGNVVKTEWFRPSQARRDMKQGSLKIVEP